MMASSGMEPDLIDQVFDPERLLKAIAQYRSMDLRSIPLTDVTELFQFVTQFNLIAMDFGGIPIFRCRKLESGDGHNHKNDIWSPAADKVKSLGRVNLPGESVFYAAFDPVTAIRETRLQPGDEFTLGNFQLSPVGEFKKTSIVVSIPNITHAQSKNQLLHSMILSDFLFSEFTRPVGEGTEFQYKASCAIAKELLDIPYKDSLVYPSMCDFKSYNMVLDNEAAEKRLATTQVFSCQLHAWSENYFPIISINKEGKVQNSTGNIVYEDFHPDAKQFELRPDKFWKGKSPNTMIAEAMQGYTT